MKIFLAIFLLFSFTAAEAKIGLQIGLIYKKGIGKGFFLSTEQHSIESVDEREEITVQMKNGVKVNISAYFVQSVHEYGPSGFIRIKGKLFDQNGKLVKTLNEPPIDIYLNETKTIVHEDEKGAEQIELIVSPVSL
jgi:uncharacterized protein YlzI (FlbEa/FlbD family)